MTDLDLTKTSTEDVDAIVAQIEGYYKQDSGTKNALSYKWELNHLMLDGQQWLTFEGNRETGGQWQRLQPSPQNEFIPRPVTNYLFDVYQTLKGYILKNKPRITVRPNTQQNKDKTAAKIAELVSNTNYERLNEVDNYEYAISCLVTYGTVFKKSFWASDYASGLVKVPRMVSRPAIDPNTGVPTGQVDQVQAVDPMTGEFQFDEMPLGDLDTAVVEPYRIALDPLASDLHNARWIMEYSIRPLNWIVENYQKDAPGYTGLAQEVKPEANLSTTMRRFFQLKSSSGVKGILSSGLGSSVSSGESSMIDEAAVVKEYYERPTQQNPHGRLLVVANNKCVFAGPSPYSGPQVGDWHPYSACRWEIVPGRFWGKSPFDDSSEIQKHINSIDSVITLARKTTAIPQKLIPRGTMAVNDSWTGRPGQKIFYTPGSNGERPENVMAQDLSPQVMQEREQKVQDIKSLTGAIDILKGDRPPGVTAFSALNLLFEVGTGKLFPIADRWKRFIETDQRKQLQIIASKYREPRPYFIQRLTSMNTELTTDQIKDFIGKDLYDNCNVLIDPSSSVPKMKAAEQAKLMELAQLGVLNLNDPANRAEFLDRMDILGFDGGYGKDANRAAVENDDLDALSNNPMGRRPIVMDCDQHDIHIAIHSDRQKEPSFLELPFEVQQAYIQHVMQHEQMKAQQEMMNMQKQAMAASMGAEPPQPPANPMGEPQKASKGKGISTKLQNSISPDLTGGGIGSRG